MDTTAALYEEFTEQMSYMEVELRLYDFYELHKISCNRQKIHGFLFAQLEKANKSIKMLIYLFLKRIKKDVVHISLNIIRMLHSADRCVKRLGLKIVKLFWGLYEFDEVIAYTIRRHPMFYDLFRQNTKYRHVYARRIAKHDARCKRLGDKAGEPDRVEGHGITKTPRRSFKNVSTAEDLKNTLERLLKDSTGEENKIFQFFVGKINLYGKADADWIPGIQLKKEEIPSANGVDLGFELELLGLKETRIYRAVNLVFERVVGM